MIRAGVIGCGYWGPNIIRNFHYVDNIEVISVCDKNEKPLKEITRTYPSLKTFTDYREVTTAKDIDAVAIITPVNTHYEIAKSALENGKHIFVEKPFTATVREAEELIALADKKNLKIMVDHTFLFTGAVRKIKELVDANELGELYYYDSTRVNLGLFQYDVNVIWDLAPHDFSIMDHIITAEPIGVSAHGIAHFKKECEDLAYVTVYFEENLIAHFNFNWLSPVKIRKTLMGGKNKMLVWDDIEADEKIKVYDKGVNIESREGLYDLLVEYRSGDMFSPRVDHKEALRLEVETFSDYIVNGGDIINDGQAGLRVVKLLEACGASLKNNGKYIKLK